MLRRFDTVPAGIILGTIVPAILYFILVYPDVKTYRMLDGYYGLLLRQVLPMLLSRCLLPNALLFFFLLWRNQTNMAKGILIITAIVTVALVLLNFVINKL